VQVVKQIEEADRQNTPIIDLFPSNNENYIIDEQDRTAEDYDRWMNNRSLFSRWMRYWISPGRVIFMNTPVRQLPSRLSLISSARILDIGCGYGSLLIYLHKKVGFSNRSEGIDISPVMVSMAEKEIRKRALEDRIRIRKGRGTKLPYPDGTFDLVLSTYVIKHLCDESLFMMMREVLRVLKKGGHFCFWEAGPSRFTTMNYLNNKLMSSELSTINIRSSEHLRMMMEKTGFSSLEQFGHAPYLYYPVMPRVGFIGVKN
jgi:ubiquinone/menaquinone biosynthesis C-methylase UbiE